jgi:antitoxin MazE
VRQSLIHGVGCPKRGIDSAARRNYIVNMKAVLVRIGNSRGIRLPKPVIEQCGFEDEVEMEVHHHELVIRSSSHPRDGWAPAFARMSECGDDELLDRVAESGPPWDEKEWEW